MHWRYGLDFDSSHLVKSFKSIHQKICSLIHSVAFSADDIAIPVEVTNVVCYLQLSNSEL